MAVRVVSDCERCSLSGPVWLPARTRAHTARTLYAPCPSRLHGSGRRRQPSPATTTTMPMTITTATAGMAVSLQARTRAVTATARAPAAVVATVSSRTVTAMVGQGRHAGCWRRDSVGLLLPPCPVAVDGLSRCQQEVVAVAVVAVGVAPQRRPRPLPAHQPPVPLQVPGTCLVGHACPVHMHAPPHR